MVLDFVVELVMLLRWGWV